MFPAADMADVAEGPAMRMVRLVWSPRSLPHAALNVPLLGALKGGFVGWFLLCGLLVAPSGAMQHPNRDWSDVAASALASGVVGGFIGSIILMALIVLIVPLSEDESTVRGRAQINVWLMIPFAALLPAAGWAFAAITTDSRVDVAAAAPVWANWPLARWAGSPGWLILLTLAMLLAGCQAARQVRRRIGSAACIACGYPLTGLAEPRCPECGRQALPGQWLGSAAPRPGRAKQHGSAARGDFTGPA